MSKILIIGGGFFGMYLADYFAKKGHTVRLVEKENQFMQKASYANQARVHNGYHYPRSILTALRSRISFPIFVKEFKDCIYTDFQKYYMIAKPLGKITANQFIKFCERIGAKCEPAKDKIASLTNPSLIEACFSVMEYAFDAIKLRDKMIERIDTSGVKYGLSTSAENVRKSFKGLEVDLVNQINNDIETVYADHVFNCTYSSINQINERSGLDRIPLKHELTEICFIDVPEEIKAIGITVMCGPFFSIMPFPALGLHTFSHVRYTPHYEWIDNKNKNKYLKVNLSDINIQNISAWKYMQKDGLRYIPFIKDFVYNRSIWEIKTVLPRSESDDSRPILFLPNYKLIGFHCIMGGKIDNVYDAIEAITSLELIK